jgi:murein DD-endopeptidase MepM/ murein hydrolase activator NlpD
MYDVNLDELVKVNRILDAARIETGRLILIPNRQKPRNLKSKSGMPSSERFAWPLRGQVISTFGQTFNNMVNKGISIRGSLNSDVIAARSGRVIFSADNFLSFGKTIIIEHPDGFSTVYARNSEVFVKAGDSISKGAVIAKVGSAGRDKNTYLHFEIRKGHIPQNPYFYLP